MKELLANFEARPPQIVFEWHDSETTAKGWVVINSLRGGAAGGGTRMRKGLDRDEVVSLAKTMEIKFSVSGPPIGGAKSGIDFDPADPRKHGVLRRWYSAVMPLLKTYYGTGGDLNVDEIAEVVPITEDLGLWHPQEGVLTGYFKPDEITRVRKIGNLRVGVAKTVEDPRYAPNVRRKYVVADLITGWGVAESVRHYYELYGGHLSGKRVIVQGWGNVGSAAAYYLAMRGAKIVGIIDRLGGLINHEGFSPETVRLLFANKQGNQLSSPKLLGHETVQKEVWQLGAEIFLPCAASRLVGRRELDLLLNGGLEVISSGANVPFADTEIFYGPTYRYADEHVALIPDFIANCGMARAFAYLMQDDPAEISDAAIFSDVSQTIWAALQHCHARSPLTKGVASTAYELALDQLMTVEES